MDGGRRAGAGGSISPSLAEIIKDAAAPSMKLTPSPMATTLKMFRVTRSSGCECGVAINKPKRDSTQEQQQSGLNRPDDPAHRDTGPHRSRLDRHPGRFEESLPGGRIEIGKHVFVGGHAIHQLRVGFGLRAPDSKPLPVLLKSPDDPSQDADHGEKNRDRDQCIEHVSPSPNVLCIGRRALLHSPFV